MNNKDELIANIEKKITILKIKQQLAKTNILKDSIQNQITILNNAAIKLS